ncbi:acyl-CoA-binding protein [Paenimyroides aestuarii]|uniref:Acyl-CoA-binding protein n=1 Tax=Paenimyroides aestuarii TaxID=2968490 RepID=A0ABY5NPS9_9FLAO|nr:acyl-CoA-binding protein [Paenimyroides aestuarii]UUV20503.1 acyl-CoA-binding protein [Paenimyroides aestuarii]
MTTDLNTLFAEAYEKASNTNKHLAPDVRLRLYAYYKQATLDYSHNFLHQDMDLIRGFKFNAWKQVAHLTQEDAKILYIELVNSLNL